MLVYDQADGGLIGVPRHERGDPASAFQRFRSLRANYIIACLGTIDIDNMPMGEVCP